MDLVWQELQLEKGAAVGLCVRSIRTCPGTTYCILFAQSAVRGSWTRTDTPHAETDSRALFQLNLLPYMIDVLLFDADDGDTCCR